MFKCWLHTARGNIFMRALRKLEHCRIPGRFDVFWRKLGTMLCPQNCRNFVVGETRKRTRRKCRVQVCSIDLDRLNLASTWPPFYSRFARNLSKSPRGRFQSRLDCVRLPISRRKNCRLQNKFQLSESAKSKTAPNGANGQSTPHRSKQIKVFRGFTYLNITVWT